MKIRLLRDTVAEGKRVKEGDVVEVANYHAKTLILMKKAVEVKPGEKAPEKKEPEKPADDGARGDLDKLTVTDLRKLATEQGIEHPEQLKKAELIEALSAASNESAA